MSRMKGSILAGRPVAAVVEVTLIIIGILLALGIDQWMESRDRTAAETQSLQLLRRDLGEAITQLEEFVRIADGTASIAVQAYGALVTPRDEIDEEATSELLVSIGVRRTVRLPRAGYTDLLSTGNLRLIEDGQVRDAVIRFYESAERTETILQRNSETLVDGQINPLFFGEGLLLPRAEGPTAYRFPLLEAAFADAAEKLGPEVVYPPDPLWALPPDAPEWDRIRSLCLQLVRVASVNKRLADGLLSEARELRSTLEAAIRNRGVP